MTLKSRSMTAIVIGIILIAVGILVWARQTGKITIFGDRLTVRQTYTVNGGSSDLSQTGAPDGNIVLTNGKIALKPQTTQTGGNWSLLADNFGTGFNNPAGTIGATLNGGNEIFVLANSDINRLSTWVFKIDNPANSRVLGTQDWMWANVNGGSYPYNLFAALNFNYVSKTNGFYALSRSMVLGLNANNWQLEDQTQTNGSNPSNHALNRANERTQSVTDGASIYVVGGFDSGNRTYSDRMAIFNLSDLNSGSWITDKEQFPSGLAKVKGESGRDGVGAAFVPDKNGRGDRIYVYGGHSSASGPGQTDITGGQFDGAFYYYQIDGNSWSPVSVNGGGPGDLAFGKMVYDAANDQLIYFGGNNGNAFSNATWVFNLQTSQWQTIATSGPAPRSLPEMMYNQDDKKIYLIGGIGANSQTFNDSSVFWQFTIPKATITYPAEGVYTSYPIPVGGSNFASWEAFDRAWRPGGDQEDLPAGTNIKYEVLNANDGTVLRTLTGMDTTYRDLSNIPTTTPLRVRITLYSNPERTATPWIRGFDVYYKTWGDYTKPTPPNDITAQASAEDCAKGNVSWTASTDQSVSKYYIRYSTDGAVIAEIKSDTNTWDGTKKLYRYGFSGLLSDTTYNVWVSAAGPDGQESSPVTKSFTTGKCANPAIQGDGWSSSDSACNTTTNKKTRTWTYTKGTGDATRLIDFNAAWNAVLKPDGTVNSDYTGPYKLMTYPIYRFVQPHTGAHYYTMSESEYRVAQDTYRNLPEGNLGYAYKTQAAGTDPIYHGYYNPRLDPFYTMSKSEYDTLVADTAHPFTPGSNGGVMGYAYKTQVTGTDKIYRIYDNGIGTQTGKHFYTMIADECKGLLGKDCTTNDIKSSDNRYVFENVMGYAYKDVKTASTEEISCNAPVQSPTVAFSATPSNINSGDKSTLTWTITGATSAKILNNKDASEYIIPNTDPANNLQSGHYSVSPTQETTYTLQATNSAGSSNSFATVKINPKQNLPTITFSAAPSNINSGDKSTLTWNVTGATTVSIDNNVDTKNAATGSVTVSPTQKTTYTLTATSSAGSITATTTVDINGKDSTPPTAPTNLTAAPVGNDGVDLSWTASTDNVGISGYTIYDASNDQMISTTTDTKFSLKGLNCGTTYKFYVKAHDSAGNKSDKSNVAEAKTGACTGAVGEKTATISEKGISAIPATLAKTTKLVSTGGSLWFNIIVALVLAGGIGFFLLRRRKEN